MNKTIKIKRGLKANLPAAGVVAGELKFTTDTKELFIGDGTTNVRLSASIIETTYAALKSLRDAGGLTPGQQYRITDYLTTTAQADTQSVGNQFDIIVTADDVDKLNENARAVQHEGDTYFANSKLEAWKLKYCLDNDTSRFAWADEVNGKGVIYRMVDEFNNDISYDFKNIQFKRDDVYYFTFTWVTEDDTIWDASIHPELTNDEGQGSRVFENTIPLAKDGYACKLNDNVFIADYDDDGGLFYGWRWNIAKDYFIGNTFSDNCYDNTFGERCYDNTFGYGCYSNTFGNNCYSNTFDNYCNSNTFGNYCTSNTFGTGCNYNTFGGNCRSNAFGNDCSNNTFGNGCYSNTFGSYCESNTFGNNCYSNTFGNNCYSNTFGNDCRYLQISDTSWTAKKYISVDSGVRGASSANKFNLYDSAILNKDYQVTFKRSASGEYLMLWATDTGAMTGKVKDSNIDTTWEDIEENDALGDIGSVLDALLGV